MVDLPAGAVEMVSYPGVFAHGRLDAGTRMLLSALPSFPVGAHGLDFGRAIGIIGAAVLQRYPSVCIDLLDVFAAAIAAARHNVPQARAILGDSWSVSGLSFYDLIVSKPPIHIGKGEDFRVLAGLVVGAPARLREGGELVLVVQRTVPVRKLLVESFPTVTLAAASMQFSVWRSGAAKRAARWGYAATPT